MGVRRTYSTSKSFPSNETLTVSFLPQSNKKVLIERVYISFGSSATSGTRILTVFIASQINPNITWRLLYFTTTSTNVINYMAIANIPIAGGEFVQSVQLTYPLILTNNDSLNFQFVGIASDSFTVFIEYLEMDLDEEIWQ